MKNLLIISNAPIIKINNELLAYSPYINEISIWNNHVKSIHFCCPVWNNTNDLLVTKIPFEIDKIFELKEFNIKNVINSIVALKAILFNIVIIFRAIRASDHVHIRCPGNVGLLACIVQIFFPNKRKTAKYAGNWDFSAKNPLSYKIQKYILRNTFLTRNMQVLVYGEWQNQTKNIKPFFTATYKESDKIEVFERNLEDKIEFLFVGMLTKGKNPFYAIQIVEKLKNKFNNVSISIYGEGKEREKLQQYITSNNLENYVFLKGNQNLDALKKAYQESHFMILPSDSEGWPKAVAEAMFWGCLPISTAVSCVANMLDNGNRGVLLTKNLDIDLVAIEKLIENKNLYQQKVTNAINWSRNYTLDLFEQEIKLLLQE